MRNKLLAAAFGYLERGWSVIPLCPFDHQNVSETHNEICKSPGKTPLYAWKEYQTRLPRRTELELYWNRQPRANIGIAMGPVSKLVAIDIDQQEAAAKLLVELSNGDIPPTAAFLTPHGGHRILYRIANGRYPDTQTYSDEAGKEILRILAKGSQTVAPPSPHQDGQYIWSPEAHIDNTVIADAPEWLLNLTRPLRGEDQVGGVQPAYTPPAGDIERRAAAYLKKCDPAVSGQGGHNQTLNVASRLVKGFAIDRDTAIQLLKQHWNPRCEPPWTDKELEHKVEDAMQNSTQPIGAILTNGSRINGHQAEQQPKQQPDQQPPKIITAAALDAMTFPPMKWAIEGILPEGATIFAGPPKVGKSWLTLGITLSIATGGISLGSIPVQSGDVLYLALEDGFRRLQGRARRIIQAQNMTPPTNLHFAVDWPRYAQGCIEQLGDWLDRHTATRLVVIDTLAKVRDARHTADALYDTDYEAIGRLQRLGQDKGIAVLIIHHTRKGGAEDELESVSGTLGLTGGADSVLVLKRQRESRDGTLFITGRDVEERKIKLTWDPEHALWFISKNQEDPESTLSPEQRKILQAVKEVNGPANVIDISHRLQKDYNATAQIMRRMAQDGLLKKSGYGKYEIHQPCQTTSNCQTTPEEPQIPDF